MIELLLSKNYGVNQNQLTKQLLKDQDDFSSECNGWRLVILETNPGRILIGVEMFVYVWIFFQLHIAIDKYIAENGSFPEGCYDYDNGRNRTDRKK